MTEGSLDTAKDEKSSRDMVSGLPHIDEATHSFEKIDRVFEVNVPYSKQGGHPVKTRKPYYKPGGQVHGITMGDDHEVRTGLTDQESPYIRSAIIYLNLLANAQFFGESETHPRPLSERIVDGFSKQDNLSYMTALKDATFDLLDDFQTRYPNLMPALTRLYQGNGADGTALSLSRAIGDLHNAKEGKIDKDAIKRARDVSRDDFVGIHHEFSRDNDRGQQEQTDDTYEKWCTGEAFAKTIAQQSIIAAMEISETPEAQGYTFSNEDEIYVSNGELHDHVEELYKKTVQQL